MSQFKHEGTRLRMMFHILADSYRRKRHFVCKQCNWSNYCNESCAKQDYNGGHKLHCAYFKEPLVQLWLESNPSIFHLLFKLSVLTRGQNQSLVNMSCQLFNGHSVTL